MPRTAPAYVNEALDAWARLGVEGHTQASPPWTPYHETLTESTAQLVGAKTHEVVVMNALTVNLHLMLASFYRPTPQRHKILMERDAFPSDRYAVASQARLRGYPNAIMEIKPRAGEHFIHHDDIETLLYEQGHSIALVLLGQVNYLTGQAFDLDRISRSAHQQDCVFGVDLAHAVGNLELRLHDDNIDFAVWCSYKYLNGGPGAVAGCFIHERHVQKDLPRLAGWWGHNKQTRFAMGPEFDAIATAEGWNISNPPILQMAALRASMEIFSQSSMPTLRKKSEQLTAYLEYWLAQFPHFQQITSHPPHERGCQLSFTVKNGNELLAALKQRGVICDFRQPNIIRFAPTPLYNRFADIYEFAQILPAALRDAHLTDKSI
jgi:kynureninase